MNNTFLPISKNEAESRGWKEPDVIIVTGDAYVDHPSYGPAAIGRLLEDAGFKVGIIAQPDIRTTADILRLGRPRLFFGVTAGNLDSMVANYTANKKPRSGDDYSPGGISLFRPDRACIAYTNKIREAYPNASIVLGGLEASMRRLAHYDYWSDSVRRSILADSKADILVYGMGECQVLEIARRLDKGEGIKTLGDINGTAIIRNSLDGIKGHITLPSFEETAKDKDRFNESFRTICLESDPFRGRTLVQQHGARFVIQLPPAPVLKQGEMDRIYSFDYNRSWHPSYDKRGGIPGLKTVKFSVISHRGCSASCSFCSLNLHQGRIIQSRSRSSILEEVRKIAKMEDFGGTITDIGGPTANMYQASCDRWDRKGACDDRECLGSHVCKHLRLGYAETMKLWDDVLKVPGVKHLFIGSGIRYDLLLDEASGDYLKKLCERHISGRLKVAPEHSQSKVLKLMNKPSFEFYDRFAARFRSASDRLGKKQFLVNYIINAHPGSTLKDSLELSLALMERHMRPEQIQDFIPLPMTLSGSMYYTGKEPITGEKVYVPKGRERTLQRSLIQYWQPKNRKYVIEALRNLGRADLKKRFYPS